MIVSARSVRRFDYADMLAQQLRALHLPPPVREYRPFPDRRYRLDLAWPDRKFYVETDGGEHLGNVTRRHGTAADCERTAVLFLNGWVGLRFMGSQVRNGTAIRFLADYFQTRGSLWT